MPFRPGPRKAERDEKGDLVYLCTWIGCEKSFGTAGHVRRHEKSHGGLTPYACQYCSKRFVRSDVRAKHVQTMHEGQDQLSVSPSGGSNENVSPTSNFPLPAMTPDVQNVQNTIWPTTFDLAGEALTSTLLAPGMLPTMPYTLDTPTSGFLDPNSLSAGPSISFDPNMDPQSNMMFPSPWESFDHVFGWGMDNSIDLDLGLPNSMFDESGIGPVSSTDTLSAAWLLCTTPRQGSPVLGEEPTETPTTQRLRQVKPHPDPFGRNDDNPWPHVFKPKVPDRPLNLGGVKAHPRIMRTGPNRVSQASRNAMLSLIYLSHQAHWLMPDIEDFPDPETLSDFVDLYFEHFHPTFPVLHKPTFLESDTPAVLLLAVAAIGATFAKEDFKPLAVALSELVRRMITWMRASDQRSKFDRHALQAFLIQTALGLTCGSREMYLHSEIFRCSLVTTCRRMHLLRPGPSATDDLYAREIVPSVEDRHRAYVEDETRRRLGWGTYLLDVQMAIFGSNPCIFSISEAGVPLPGDSTLWEAPDANAWAAAAARLETQATDPIPPVYAPFLHVLSAALSGKHYAKLNDFASCILAHTLYRLSLDAYLLQRALGADGPSDPPEIGTCYPPILGSKPDKVLLALAQSSFKLTNTSHLRMTPTAMYHHAQLQFTRPGLIENVKLASGKSEPDMNKKAGIKWLKDWVRDGREVRLILWHAAILNALLTEYPRGALSEVFWTIDAALMLWAVVKYGPEKLRPLDSPDTFYTSTWLDTTPPPQWLMNGGTVVLPFLGSSVNLTVTSCLSFFIDRLENMPWGLAGLFRQVLVKLLEADKE